MWLESEPSGFFAPPTHADLVALEGFVGRWAGHHRELQCALGTVRQSFTHKTISLNVNSWLGDPEGVGSCELMLTLYCSVKTIVDVESIPNAGCSKKNMVITLH